ncbi:MAG: galactokinase family protein [Spirochaetales bacterium]|nr:galactokinase family protein [Spirochaetales bacterium]
MDTIASLHQNEYHEEPRIIVSAPGQVNLMGERNEFADAYVMGMALDKRLTMALSLTEENSLYLYSATLGERKKVNLSTLKNKREDRWANYFKGIIVAFLQLGAEPAGVKVTIGGDLPPGIGLGSSSAMQVAFAFALNELFDCGFSLIQLADIARLADYQFLKDDSGIASPLISCLGREGNLLMIDTKDLTSEMYPIDCENHSLIITNSHVPFHLGKDDQIDFRQEYKDAGEIIRKHKMASSLRDLTGRDISQTVEILSEDTRRYCLHLSEENQRVLDMKEALEGGDCEQVARLLIRSHESLRDLLEISCPELDWLVKRVQEMTPLSGSRMFGPGFGGCTISLIHDSNIAKYEEVLEEYERIFGFKAEYFLCRPSAGVRQE